MSEVNSAPSVMVLVKNEAFWLPYTLTQTEGLFNSYVIYDVGSTDGTREIIRWWMERMTGKANIYTRYLPHCPPEVQGAFRNSMSLEGNRPTYLILDGDELYARPDLELYAQASNVLLDEHEKNDRIKYGVMRRIEVAEDLRRFYDKQKTHHRLYIREAWWTGTHPGERAFYNQNDKSEIQFPEITCFHMHNTLRSPNEGEVPGRMKRKQQGTYHPEGELREWDLLNILPMLREPVNGFAVTPALKALQDEYKRAR